MDYRKLIITIAGSITAIVVLGGCNKQIIDLNYTFNKAQIVLPDGTIITGNVESWNDYEGEQLQIKIDGTVYVAHSENAVLISE